MNCRVPPSIRSVAGVDCRRQAGESCTGGREAHSHCGDRLPTVVSGTSCIRYRKEFQGKRWRSSFRQLHYEQASKLYLQAALRLRCIAQKSVGGSFVDCHPIEVSFTANPRLSGEGRNLQAAKGDRLATAVASRKLMVATAIEEIRRNPVGSSFRTKFVQRDTIPKPSA